MEQTIQVSPAHSSSLPSTPDQSATTSCSRIYNPCSGISLDAYRKSAKERLTSDLGRGVVEPFSGRGADSPKMRSRYCFGLLRRARVPSRRNRSRKPITIHCISYPDEADADDDRRESPPVGDSPKCSTPIERRLTDDKLAADPESKQEKRSRFDRNTFEQPLTVSVLNRDGFGGREMARSDSGEKDPEIERIKSIYLSGLRGCIRNNNNRIRRTFTRSEILKLDDSRSTGSGNVGRWVLSPGSDTGSRPASGIRITGVHGNEEAANRMRDSNGNWRREADDVSTVYRNGWREFGKHEANVGNLAINDCGKSALRHCCTGIPETTGIPRGLGFDERKAGDKLEISLSLNTGVDSLNLSKQQRFRLYE